MRQAAVVGGDEHEPFPRRVAGVAGEGDRLARGSFRQQAAVDRHAAALPEAHRDARLDGQRRVARHHNVVGHSVRAPGRLPGGVGTNHQWTDWNLQIQIRYQDEIRAAYRLVQAHDGQRVDPRREPVGRITQVAGQGRLPAATQR